ncbi:MAG: DUF1573 domain-containing protein [Bacteroidetes bacterium]|nr:MAG: DUF1573 domain-containing protein [Bacteroidota bacterium]
MKMLLFTFFLSLCTAISAQTPFSLKVIGHYSSFATQSGSQVSVRLGPLSYTKIQPIEFELTNCSDTVLIITRLHWGEPQCGPTNFPKEPILPGESVQFRYFCASNRPGRSHRVATVVTNLGRAQIHFEFDCPSLNIQGNHQIFLKLDPDTQRYSGMIQLHNLSEEDIELNLSDEWYLNGWIWGHHDKHLKLLPKGNNQLLFSLPKEAYHLGYKLRVPVHEKNSDYFLEYFLFVKD